MKDIDFNLMVRAPEGVLVRELDGESVLLNLESEIYFGLDVVGTRIWALLNEASSIQAAYEILKNEYNVDPDTLRRDMAALISQLLDHKLVEIRDS